MFPALFVIVYTVIVSLVQTIDSIELNNVDDIHSPHVEIPLNIAFLQSKRHSLGNKFVSNKNDVYNRDLLMEKSNSKKRKRRMNFFGTVDSSTLKPTIDLGSTFEPTFKLDVLNTVEPTVKRDIDLSTVYPTFASDMTLSTVDPTLQQLKMVLAKFLMTKDKLVKKRELNALAEQGSQSTKKLKWGSDSNTKWNKWTEWSSCSVTCGKGREIRWRHCRNNCNGIETEMEEKACQLPACPRKLFGIIKL